MTSLACWAEQADPRLSLPPDALCGGLLRPPQKRVAGARLHEWLRRRRAAARRPDRLVDEEAAYRKHQLLLADVQCRGRNPFAGIPETAAPMRRAAVQRRLHPVPRQRPASAPARAVATLSGFRAQLSGVDLTPAARDTLAEAFASADVNGDGTLSKDEAVDFLESSAHSLGGVTRSDSEQRTAVTELFRQVGARSRITATALASFIAQSHSFLQLPAMRRVWVWRTVPEGVAVPRDCRSVRRTGGQTMHGHAVAMAGCCLRAGQHRWRVRVENDSDETQVGVVAAEAGLDLGLSLTRPNGPNARHCWVYCAHGFVAHGGVPRIPARRAPDSGAFVVTVDVDVASGRVGFAVDGCPVDTDLYAPPGTPLRPVCAVQRVGATAYLTHVHSVGGEADATS